MAGGRGQDSGDPLGPPPATLCALSCLDCRNVRRRRTVAGLVDVGRMNRDKAVHHFRPVASCGLPNPGLSGRLSRVGIVSTRSGSANHFGRDQVVSGIAPVVVHFDWTLPEYSSM